MISKKTTNSEQILTVLKNSEQFLTICNVSKKFLITFNGSKKFWTIQKTNNKKIQINYESLIKKSIKSLKKLLN